jgi:LTXXQ motif family protein
MQHTGFRTATAIALILPALAVAGLVTEGAAQVRRGGGPAPAAAPHISAPAPAPHISAPAPAPHVSAPAPTPHFAPQIAAPRSVAPTPRVSAPVTRNVTPTPRVNAPVHVATPNITRPNVTRPNTVHPNANVRPNTAGTLARQQRIEERRVGQAHGNPTINKTPETIANPNVPSNKNTQTRTSTTPNLARLPNENRGRNVTSGEAARAQIYAAGKRPVLRNQTFAGLSTRDPATRSLATSNFRGRFADFRDRDRDRDRGRFRGSVIGWFGPLFWPYAYSDFVDYTFWPYADDTFWPYAYDDVYEGIYGPYAPPLTQYATLPGERRGVRTRTPSSGGYAQVCTAQASGLTDWPIERIAQQVQPNDQQRAALDDLKSATAKAVDILQAACPTDLPSTPPGRLTAMRQRLEAMLQAVQVVRPAMDRLYGLLSDEQKERFNALDTAANAPARSPRGQPDLAQLCSGQAARVTLPTDRLVQLLRPDDAQRAALDELNDASNRAAGILNANCPGDQPITPPGRLAAMEQRLNGMLQAVNTVQPALAKFYNLLSDEQKARFDRLPPRQT